MGTSAFDVIKTRHSSPNKRALKYLFYRPYTKNGYPRGIRFFIMRLFCILYSRNGEGVGADLEFYVVARIFHSVLGVTVGLVGGAGVV